ncbi:MAG: hydroxymethylglutaryl-CoA reductase, degradative [Candidatus Bathyarchaeota archaeon]|nr:MAG: hydroxymethylglutaryl-CoA reductase, degradative [Candidatus Bathyarchaeota archaeon]
MLIMSRTSQFSGFYRLTPKQRAQVVKEYADLTDEEVRILLSTGSLKMELANRMVENVVGTFPLPLGIAVNFLINGRDYLIPMAIEEPSVVAAASYAAKMTRASGGFFTSSTEPIMIGQIQAVNISKPQEAKRLILKAKDEILRTANEQDPLLVSVGGGAKDLDVKVLETKSGPMVITELHVNCGDAMGANAVNTMAEAVAPIIERITQGRVNLRIISNLATKRMARAWTTIPKEELGGDRIVDGIIEAYDFAVADPYRAATHNKGALNGIIGVVVATCNDHRAVEAGAHAYAARSGQYSPLTVWEKNKDGNLTGSIELPMAVGTIGGATKVHPVARIALKILGVNSAKELAEVLAAVGLAQNLGALRALAHEGIQRGHMALHARNVAIMAGAPEEMVDGIVEKMVKEGKVRLDRAKELVEEYTKTK